MFSKESALKLLNEAGVFFGSDGDDHSMAQVLNMNDTWAWACADGEEVSDAELPRVAELFYRYGRCGILYWVSEKHKQMKSEFHDINRFIEFVRAEENLRQKVPGSSDRAYTKMQYTIGTKP